MFVLNSVARFKTMRMEKSGNQTLTLSYAKVTTWAAAAAYPNTNIVSNGLTMLNGGSGLTITANAAVTDTFSNTYTVDIRKNGTSIGTPVALTTSGGTVVWSLAGQSVNPGDVLEMYAKASDNFNSPRVSGGTTSFLRIE